MPGGALLLFDISGYTEFLNRSDLAQAPGILQSLVGTLVEHIAPPLVVAEIEGDAVFVYAPGAAFRRGETLLEAIEKLYCVFCAARERMEHDAACDCSGCRQFPRLDLKVVAHHGEFALSRIARGQNEKPVGADVVLAHRLLKNRITHVTGVRAWAFITDACANAAGLDWLAGTTARHEENYPDVGTVGGWVVDLAPVWAAERATRLAAVEPGEAWIEIETEIAAPLQLVWDRIASPRFRSLWRRADRVEAGAGRTRPGTVDRCFQGEIVSVERVLDWRPFERVTLECDWPLAPPLRVTTELAPAPGGTRLVTRLVADAGAGRARQTLARSWFRLRGAAIAEECRANLEQLKEWILEDDGRSEAGPGAPPAGARPARKTTS
jgi:uncharacterized protein YndB with AHSA1/START domain